MKTHPDVEAALKEPHKQRVKEHKHSDMLGQFIVFPLSLEDDDANKSPYAFITSAVKSLKKERKKKVIFVKINSRKAPLQFNATDCFPCYVIFFIIIILF